MAIRIITRKKISIQQNITDYTGMYAFEEIDLRTPEGVQRYKEIFGCQPNSEGTNYRRSRKSHIRSSKPLEHVRFLSNIYNERDRRLFGGFLATIFRHGGIKKAAKLMELDVKTVRKGKNELVERVNFDKSRVRREGGGRLTKVQVEPLYESELQDLIENEMAGDPMKERIWIRKTVRWMQENLRTRGIGVSLGTIWNTLKNLKISLKKNKKSKSTQDHPRRDEQFKYLNKLKQLFLDMRKPGISVDAKKKENLGNFKNDGKTWRIEAIEVLDHDFPSLGGGKLVPFGIYDLKNNEGTVYCGSSFETSEFAVDCICEWWEKYGRVLYPDCSEILIVCDSGGSNGYRRRMWKWALQTKLADRFGLSVHVCHYPPGASKYNPIERKLFCFISKNWAGEPLTNVEKALGFINSTKTEGGLKVRGFSVEKEYKKGIKVSNEQMESLNIKHAKICPKWNYCISPR
ncbi:MAG: ISAzo13 family transposase [Promethearchaeota archaeon]